MRKSLVLAWVVLLTAIGLTACGPKSVIVDVDMKEYAFSPATIEVPAGAQVTLDLKNSGTLEHEIVIMISGTQATVPYDEDDELNVFWETKLEMGGSANLTFTAPTEKGEYQIVCGIPAHLEQGMVGKLIVK